MKGTSFLLPSILVIAAGCSHKNHPVTENGDGSPDIVPITVKSSRIPDSNPVKAVLKASAFRMSGDYQDNVAIGVNPDGQISYFPDPTDISDDSAPISLGNGWWLNRQGVRKGYRFTEYTFKEYMSLPAVPGIGQLQKSIIPGAEVTDVRTFDIPASEAVSRIDEIRSQLSHPVPKR